MPSQMMTVAEVAAEMSYSISHSYKIIKMLNQELKSKGFIVRPGMVPRKYFYERTGLMQEEQNLMKEREPSPSARRAENITY